MWSVKRGPTCGKLEGIRIPTSCALTRFYYFAVVVVKMFYARANLHHELSCLPLTSKKYDIIQYFKKFH